MNSEQSLNWSVVHCSLARLSGTWVGGRLVRLESEISAFSRRSDEDGRQQGTIAALLERLLGSRKSAGGHTKGDGQGLERPAGEDNVRGAQPDHVAAGGIVRVAHSRAGRRAIRRQGLVKHGDGEGLRSVQRRPRRV